MPEWLAITLGLCAAALTIVQLLIRVGMWGGRLEQPKSSNGEGVRHEQIMSQLAAIREDTTQLRAMSHNLINAFAGVQLAAELMKDDLKSRRRIP